jgi:malate dehydrogenase (oxaloacetate-decarboxylating)
MLKKAYKPARDALALHPFYRGKIAVSPKVCVRSLSDFSIWYTPGVAEPCKEIAAAPEKVYDHTNKGNAVAVVSDGTRVLGLGNIGPEAALPVMEGKALIFKYLGGVDAYPICLNARDPERFIDTVKALQPSFGGINLEDIENPKCFYILDRLREEMDIPVWHDDQQGTATIEVAGAINALAYVGKPLEEAAVTMVGAGAANIAIARLLVTAGVKKKNIIMVDSKGTLHAGRADLEAEREHNPYKWDMCVNANGAQTDGSMLDGARGADILIAASRPGPGTISPEVVRSMADDAIVFATANPIPEIWPWEAKEAGALIVATGRSDFPNQINNSLGFPGIFRGTLDVQASTITDNMCIAAATAIAEMARERELTPEYLVPSMAEWEVFPREAAAVGTQAVKDGVAVRKRSYEELYEMAESMISDARAMTQLLMDKGIIKAPPKENV